MAEKGRHSEPGLVVIGINHHASQVEVRERFWIGESRLYPALQELARARGIEEIVLLSTCNRTEFILWADDPNDATNSVQEFLICNHGLQPTEWKEFYHHRGEEALAHVLRVTSSLDSMVVGEPEVTGQVKAAWAKAQQAGTTSRFLDALFQKALTVSKRVRNETSIGVAAVSVPYAAVELARQIFGSLAKRSVMVLGAGKMGEMSARYLVNQGATTVWVTNRTLEHAQVLAKELGGEAVAFEDRWQRLAEADIVISSTGCPHIILSREDAVRIHQARQGRPIFMIDIAVPRDIDPGVRDVPGVFLYDIDDLEQVVERNRSERLVAAAHAERLVAEEAHTFLRKLDGERVVPTIVALRGRLEELLQQELESYRSEAGPLTAEQEQHLETVTARLVHRIAGQLARELKQVAERPEQDQLAAAIRKLFRLPRSAKTERGVAGLAQQITARSQ